MRLRPQSLRVRLALTFAAALAVLLAAFSVSVYALMRAQLLRQIQGHARQDLALVERTLEEAPDDLGELEEHGLVSLYTVMRGATTVYTSAAWNAQELPATAATDPSLTGWRWRTADGRTYVIAASRVDSGVESFRIAVAEDDEPVRSSLASLGLILLIGVPVAIAGAFGGGWLLARRMLAPVLAMASAAGRITEERLSDRLPVQDPRDEFGSLAIVVNQTLERLEDAFEKLRRFTTDASHELRTPLTALKGVGEFALREEMAPSQYRETIASMLEECDRLTSLVDDLLTLTREDSDGYRARFESLDLGRLAHEVVEVLSMIAEDRGLHLEFAGKDDVIVLGDRTTLRQAIVNLVDNAIKYTPRGGTIRVRVEPLDAATVGVEVADTGPGIPSQHRERIFERFFRIERDRSRSNGGAGLGLPIARWAVELHRGSLDLDPEGAGGSTFRIRLPRISAEVKAS